MCFAIKKINNKKKSLSKPKELTPQEVNDRVNQILSGGKLRRRNFM